MEIRLDPVEIGTGGEQVSGTLLSPAPMLPASQLRISSRKRPNIVNRKAMNWLFVIDDTHRPKATCAHIKRKMPR